MSDPHSSTHCDWCGKYMINLEAQTKTVNAVEYTLCEYCNEFDSKVEMEAAKATIIKNAINPDDLVEGNSDSVGYPWI